MISISGKKWTEIKVNKNLIEKVNQDFNFGQLVSKLIVSRNFDLQEIYSIRNEIKINNEFNNTDDFVKATDILINSIKNKENICILGDYDVDGIVSTSILVRFFDYIKQPYFYYIPDRIKDGYGATKKLFEKLILKKPNLIIMVDCGSNSNNAIDFLNQNKIKSIVIDHHEINKPYPKSNIIINPKKNSDYNKYNYLCASALTYFFLEIIIKKTKSNFKLNNLLIYVFLASITDVMPIRKINRLIGLKLISNFKIKENIVFDTIYKLSKKNNNFSSDDLGYFIGPIINSCGRLGKSSHGVELLSSNNLSIIKNISNHLIKLNNKRKEIENNILKEVNFEKIQNQNKNIIIYYKPNINEGLIGIIAARIKDYFHKPTIVITNSKNLLKASARSMPNYNIGHVIKILIDKKIIINGGGHNMAAGFTMHKRNIKILENYLMKDFEKKNINLNYLSTYDFQISSSAINKKLFNEIKELEPFGAGNLLPTFFIKDLKIIKKLVIKNKHISAILKPKQGTSIKSICFNSLNTKIGEYLLSYKKSINVIGQIYENDWNNKKNIQLIINDILL